MRGLRSAKMRRRVAGSATPLWGPSTGTKPRAAKRLRASRPRMAHCTTTHASAQADARTIRLRLARCTCWSKSRLQRGGGNAQCVPSVAANNKRRCVKTRHAATSNARRMCVHARGRARALSPSLSHSMRPARCTRRPGRQTQTPGTAATCGTADTCCRSLPLLMHSATPNRHPQFHRQCALGRSAISPLCSQDLLLTVATRPHTCCPWPNRGRRRANCSRLCRQSP